MTILEKLTPPPVPAETSSPAGPLTADQKMVVDRIIAALKARGVVLKPEDVQGQAVAPAPVLVPVKRDPMTPDETALLARSSTFIFAALQRHGISLAPSEIIWMGAEVADFVLGEMPKKAV